METATIMRWTLVSLESSFRISFSFQLLSWMSTLVAWSPFVRTPPRFSLRQESAHVQSPGNLTEKYHFHFLRGVMRSQSSSFLLPPRMTGTRFTPHPFPPYSVWTNELLTALVSFLFCLFLISIYLPLIMLYHSRFRSGVDALFSINLDLPPAKRRKGLAGSVLSAALSAALVGTAVGLTVYRL